MNNYYLATIKVILFKQNEELYFKRNLYFDGGHYDPVQIKCLRNSNEYFIRNFEIIDLKIINNPKFMCYKWFSEKENIELEDLPKSSAIRSINDELNQFYVKDQLPYSPYYKEYWIVNINK